MSQTELQHLAHIREAAGRTNRFLQTINANIIHLDSSIRQMTEALKTLANELTRDIDLDKLVEDSRKIAEAGRNFEQIQLPDYPDSGPDIGFSIPLNGVNWQMNDLVKVIDGEAEGYHMIGRVKNARGWPDNFELAVDFSENEVTFTKYTWFPVGRLERIVVDENNVELPAVIDKTFGNQHTPDDQGRLFPWQWRHNLGWDKISKELREYHRTHENHPMTEEAFRIYNAGLTAEISVNDKKDQL